MPMHAHACPCMPMQNHSTYIRPATPHARTWTHTRGNDMVVHIGESSLTHRVRSRDRAIDLDLDLDLARGRPVLRYPQPTVDGRRRLSVDDSRRRHTWSHARFDGHSSCLSRRTRTRPCAGRSTPALDSGRRHHHRARCDAMGRRRRPGRGARAWRGGRRRGG